MAREENWYTGYTGLGGTTATLWLPLVPDTLIPKPVAPEPQPEHPQSRTE